MPNSPRPATPVADSPILVTVVGRRCVYVNDRRVAGSKPYVSEGLPQHDFRTTLGDILEAFDTPTLLAAMEEREAVQRWMREKFRASEREWVRDNAEQGE